MQRSIRLSLLIAVFLISLLAVQIALAGDTGSSSPLDPEANACFEGGTLAGQCDTEDMWHAGWYLIRVEQGVMAAEDVPAKYGRILVELAPDYNWCLDDDSGGQNGDDPQTGDDQHNGDDQHQDDPEEEICFD